MNFGRRSRVKFLKLIFLVFLSWLQACAWKSSSPLDRNPDSLTVFSSEKLYGSNHHPRCKALVDSYCNYLYSPGVLGNLEIRHNNFSSEILEGETSNQFSEPYFRYSLAKLRNQRFLPKDFYRILGLHNYFGALETFLGRKPITKMDLNERIATERTDYKLSYIWQSSFDETLMRRLEKRFPGYHRLTDELLPIELQVQRRKMRRILISQISQALWRDDKNWQHVVQEFNALKQSYYRVFGKLDIPDSIKQDWTKRISELKLVMPGALPEISDDECTTTTSNAYYYTYLNLITVCAGDFNTENIVQTLSHEMAHSLGLDRSEYLFEHNSKFGHDLTAFRSKVCAPKAFTCDDWSRYKTAFNSDLNSLDGFQVQLPGFERCLKRRVTSNVLNYDDIERFAQTTINDQISEFASNDRFLRITKSQIPMRNGKSQPNPNYLNPCAYYLWSHGEEPIDDELTTLMYFTAEYRCSAQKADPDRLKDAIDVARQMSEQVIEKTIGIEGEFSGRDLLETEGYSSPPFERFADVVGSYALADYLNQIPDRYVRQNTYLASTSWLCLEPSLATDYPQDSSIEKAYIYDSHPGSDQRKKELLSKPIREAIGCEKDFSFNECKLPFKGDEKPPKSPPSQQVAHE